MEKFSAANFTSYSCIIDFVNLKLILGMPCFARKVGACILNIQMQNPFIIRKFQRSVLEWFGFGMVGTMAPKKSPNHSKTEKFPNQTALDHSNFGHVQYLSPHCICQTCLLIKNWTNNPDLNTEHPKAKFIWILNKRAISIQMFTWLRGSCLQSWTFFGIQIIFTAF